ncbi:MAG: hypothetical protein CML20_04865 [Rheinheimera sp.]|uniref:hypothetical protein n=1 Tax=Arsukibacterium sp. UBA3155 TaxID=1946058 RepID=UPI000C9781E4|nr:hypothetical protein [Arsukibacterium sp. UBA3155]MAD74121.1 hypothetical protein [Rheinheimera sp.]|tara:strand:- start:23120 stop:23575 length:456 start_codon:yes stop_codon:yes gene_type:complete
MKKFILYIFFIFFSFFVSSNQDAFNASSLSEKEKSLLWFVEDVLIKDNSKRLPAALSDDLKLVGMSSHVDGKNIFLVSDLVLNAQKENFQMSVEEFYSVMREQLIIAFCSQIKQKEYIFEGFSKVGNINRYYDSAQEFFVEIKIGLNNCTL